MLALSETIQIGRELLCTVTRSHGLSEDKVFVPIGLCRPDNRCEYFLSLAPSLSLSRQTGLQHLRRAASVVLVQPAQVFGN